MTLSVAEAADHLGIGRNRTYDLVNAGILPAVKIGRTIRIPTDALKRWLEKEAARTGNA